MNVGAIETYRILTDSTVPVNTSRPQRDSFQMQQASGGDGAANSEEINQVVAEMQVMIDSMNINLQFSTYGAHGERIAIDLVNKETGELIREIPLKELRSLYAKMSKLAGIIFDEDI